MRQDELSPAPGSKKDRKIVGRGIGSGHGGRSGKGDKGQKARSGAQHRPMLEGGGVMPSLLRLPHKHGFTNVFRVSFNLVHVGDLNIFTDGSEVTPEKLLEMRLVKNLANPIKVLADGELTRKLTVKANAFSNAAKTKIESAGGTAEEIGNASEGR